jgi:ATP synthase protein I
MKRWQASLQLLGIGWYIALCIVLGVLGGVWLDGKTGSKPLWTIIGLILGVVIAFTGAYRMVSPFINKKNNRKDS